MSGARSIYIQGFFWRNQNLIWEASKAPVYCNFPWFNNFVQILNHVVLFIYIWWAVYFVCNHIFLLNVDLLSRNEYNFSLLIFILRSTIFTQYAQTKLETHNFFSFILPEYHPNLFGIRSGPMFDSGNTRGLKAHLNMVNKPTTSNNLHPCYSK